MKEMFDEVLDSFENEDIRKFMEEKCIPTIPDWFWVAPAASSGRFHPRTSLGEGGLARHTVSLCRFLNYMLEVELIRNQFTSRERDLLRVAGLMHDTRKSGSQEDYEQNKMTKFDHPLLAARVVADLDGLPREEILLVAKTIAAHMGQFNTSNKAPGITLPKPANKYELIVHLADYISSRKDVDMRFDMMPEYKEVEATAPPDINTWRFTFGKHAGKTIPEILKEDPQYIRWAKENMTKEPAKTLLGGLKL